MRQQEQDIIHVGKHCCPPHPAETVEIRKKRSVSGLWAYALQCQNCGEKVGRRLEPARIRIDTRKVKLWNGRAAHRPQPNAKRREYLARFRRSDWKRLRSQVLERDAFTCQNCGEHATQAHHLTYERFGAEKLSDLVALCGPCNLLERENRL